MQALQPMSLHLATERLVMRPWSLADVGDYRALVAERGGPMPSDIDIRDRIASQLAATTRTGLALLPLRRLVGEDFLGYCGLLVGRASDEEPEIAFELFRHTRRRGYATEAAHAVLDAAIVSGRSRLWSTVRAWNAPSLRVLDKLGFAHDHTSVDDSGELVWLTRSLL